MQKKRIARLARVLGLALVIWPLAGSGSSPDKGQEGAWQIPAVSRCQASPHLEALKGKLEYDADGIRCVVGGGGCIPPPF
jgi:hypothetical protein